MGVHIETFGGLSGSPYCRQCARGGTMMIELYLYLLVVLVALALCWRTVAALSLVAVAAHVTRHPKTRKR